MAKSDLFGALGSRRLTPRGGDAWMGQQRRASQPCEPCKRKNGKRSGGERSRAEIRERLWGIPGESPCVTGPGENRATGRRRNGLAWPAT